MILFISCNNDAIIGLSNYRTKFNTVISVIDEKINQMKLELVVTKPYQLSL